MIIDSLEQKASHLVKVYNLLQMLIIDRKHGKIYSCYFQRKINLWIQLWMYHGFHYYFQKHLIMIILLQNV